MPKALVFQEFFMDFVLKRRIWLKSIFFLLVFLLFSISSTKANNVDSLLIVLDQTIENRSVYEQEKLQTINRTKNLLRNENTLRNTAVEFSALLELVEAYQSYNYDSAFCYIRKALKTAYFLNNRNFVEKAKSQLGFILLSKGLFKEAIDTLETVDVKQLSYNQQITHYGYLTRAYIDLANYADDHYFSKKYVDKANLYFQKIILSENKNTYQFLMFEAYYLMSNNQLDDALSKYLEVLRLYNLNSHQKAITYSSIGHIYYLKKQYREAKFYTIEAVIFDIKSTVKETAALRKLAEILFYEGDIEKAYKYILLANEDAKFYGARQRKLEISRILPLIEGAKLQASEKKKSQYTIYSIGISIVALVVFVLLLVIFKQFKKIKTGREELEKSHNRLTNSNSKLIESNKIKELHIAWYFNLIAQALKRLDTLKQKLTKQVESGRVEVLRHTIQKINVKEEREALFQNFDEMFLEIFPDFTQKFNEMLNQESRFEIAPNSLNVYMRIFALIRLGITDNEKIAKILDLSVNTIYTYKTRIKKKSPIVNEDFEDRIMKIQSI